MTSQQRATLFKLLFLVQLPTADAFRVDPSVDLMNYARDHDLWKQQRQHDMEKHKIRLHHDPISPQVDGEYASADRTWRFPEPSMVRRNQDGAFPHDLTSQERLWQGRSSYSRQRHSTETKPYVDGDRLWRLPSRAWIRQPDDNFFSPLLEDDDRSFWNKRVNCHHLLLEEPYNEGLPDKLD